MIFNLAQALYVCTVIQNLYLLVFEVRQLAMLEEMVARRRIEGFANIISTLRPDACLLVEKGCNYGIFDEVLEENGLEDESPVGICSSYYRGGYRDAHSPYKIVEPFSDAKLTYFILSPYIRKDPNYKCHHVACPPSMSLDYKMYGLFARIFNDVVKLGLTHLSYKGIVLRKKAHAKYEELYCSIEELGSVQATSYYTRNVLMGKINEILHELLMCDRSSMDKSAWCTRAVSMIMDLLVDHGILKSRVSLGVYPELVPLLMPFPILDITSSHWSMVNIVVIGFDLRRVAGSELVSLFNMSLVNELCIDEGVYIAYSAYR